MNWYTATYDNSSIDFQASSLDAARKLAKEYGPKYLGTDKVVSVTEKQERAKTRKARKSPEKNRLVSQ